MSRAGKAALIAALLLLGVGALLLQQIHHLQKLGKPGVKVVSREMYDDQGVLRGTNVVDLPAEVLDWKSVAPPISTQVVKWLPQDTVYGQRLYSAPDGVQMQMNVVLMGTDRTSIHKPEYCLPSQGVAIESRETRFIPIRSPHPYSLPVTVFTLAREFQWEGKKVRDRALYVFWFVADNEITADHWERMRWMAGGLLTRFTLERWAYVSCVMASPPGKEEATFARMSAFLEEAVPKFQLATGLRRAEAAAAPAAAGPLAHRSP